MIRKEEGPVAVPAGPDKTLVSAEIIGGQGHPVQARRRRLVALQVGLAGASIVASLVLYSVTGVAVALERAGPFTRDMYAFIGILVPAGHAGLAFLLVSGIPNAGRYAGRGTWILALVHLLWGGGIGVGHWPALPVGLVLVAGDALFLWWLRPVRERLDTGGPDAAQGSSPRLR